MIRSYKSGDVVKILDFIKGNPQQLIIFQTNVVNKKNYAYECHISENDGVVDTVILSQGSSAYVTLSDKTDIEELVMFFKFNGAVSEINGTVEDIDRLLPYFENADSENYYIAKLSGTPNEFPCKYAFKQTDGIRDLRGVYSLLEKGGMTKVSFDEYYIVRREAISELKGRTYIAYDGDIPVCTASSVYEMHPLAFLGGVATDPEYRNMGIAKGLVSELCKALTNEGFSVWISYKTDIAGKVYKHIGFEDCLKCKRII